MKEVRFQYKCRHCSEVFDGVCCGEDFAFGILSCVIIGVRYPTAVGLNPRLLEFHICDKEKGTHGVADLIGYTVFDEDDIDDYAATGTTGGFKP